MEMHEGMPDNIFYNINQIEVYFSKQQGKRATQTSLTDFYHSK